MKHFCIQLICCLSIVLILACFADDLTESRRKVLFDFTHGTPGTVVPGWEHLQWIDGKENAAEFMDRERRCLKAFEQLLVFDRS